jgi:hypothetical protein
MFFASSPPRNHARHYIGWALDVEARLAGHLAGAGSPLVRAAMANWRASRTGRSLPDLRRRVVARFIPITEQLAKQVRRQQAYVSSLVLVVGFCAAIILLMLTRWPEPTCR